MAVEEQKPLLDGPIPGMSMTHELGARPWQTPAQYTTVDEAIEYYMSRMATEEYMEQAVEVLEMGVPVTTIANTMQMASVMEGKHSIDVGMLVTPLIMEMLMLIGENAGIKYDDGLSAVEDNTISVTAIEKVRNEMKSRIDEVEDKEEIVDSNKVEVEEPTGLMARRN
jgi:hypothetical protein